MQITTDVSFVQPFSLTEIKEQFDDSVEANPKVGDFVIDDNQVHIDSITGELKFCLCKFLDDCL